MKEKTKRFIKQKRTRKIISLLLTLILILLANIIPNFVSAGSDKKNVIETSYTSGDYNILYTETSAWVNYANIEK